MVFLDEWLYTDTFVKLFNYIDQNCNNSYTKFGSKIRYLSKQIFII